MASSHAVRRSAQECLAKAVEGQLRYGRWTRLQRGIYAAFTGDPSRGAQLWAALLRAGPGAMFSHETAAELAGLTGRPSPSIHITVPASRQPGRSREISGVVIHRSRHFDRARHPTLLPPQTRVEETVLDLTQQAATFENAFTWLCRAVGQRLTTPERLRQAAKARSRLRWRTEISAALGEVSEGARCILEFGYVGIAERPHGPPGPPPGTPGLPGIRAPRSAAPGRAPPPVEGSQAAGCQMVLAGALDGPARAWKVGCHSF